MDGDKVIIYNAGRRPLSRAVILWGMVLILVILLTGIFWFILHRSQQSHQLQTSLTSARKDLANGRSNEALSTLQNVMADAHTKTQKHELYQLIVAASSSSGDVQGAIKYYGLDNQLDPNYTDANASNLGLLYLEESQYQQAVTQFKIALPYLESQEQHASKQNRVSIGQEMSYIMGNLQYAESHQ